MMINGQLEGGIEGLPDGLLGGVQQLIHLLVVSEMLAGLRSGGRGRAGADHGHPQVVVDMGVHARQRELNRFDPVVARRSASGRQASGTAAGTAATSAAAKYRLANVTSSWVMNAGSA